MNWHIVIGIVLLIIPIVLYMILIFKDPNKEVQIMPIFGWSVLVAVISSLYVILN